MTAEELAQLQRPMRPDPKDPESGKQVCCSKKDPLRRRAELLAISLVPLLGFVQENCAELALTDFGAKLVLEALRVASHLCKPEEEEEEEAKAAAGRKKGRVEEQEEDKASWMALAASALFAAREAIASARADAGVSGWFELDAPLTVERVQQACHLGEHRPAELPLL